MHSSGMRNARLLTVYHGGFRISPRRGCQLPMGAPTYDFVKISPKTAWNLKNLDTGGRGVVSLVPPLDPPIIVATVSWLGFLLLRGGLPSEGGSACPWHCGKADPRVNRMTRASENISLAHTSCADGKNKGGHSTYPDFIAGSSSYIARILWLTGNWLVQGSQGDGQWCQLQKNSSVNHVHHGYS